MKKVLLILVSFLLAISLLAQVDEAEQYSQQAANPLANLMSFPFQNNLNGSMGPYNRNTNVLNIQPVIPFLNGSLVTRTIFPIVRIPDYSSETGKYSSGLSDIVFTAFYVPKSKMLWGIGPVMEFPTGGEERGTQKWSAGPSFLILDQPGHWTYGFLLYNVWSYAGVSDRDNVNKMLLNLFLVRQLGDGWYLNTSPIITANWTAEKDSRWIVPLGAGGGKLIMLGGKLPLNLQTQFYYNVVSPDFGPKWQWRFQMQFLLPTSIFKKKQQ